MDEPKRDDTRKLIRELAYGVKILLQESAEDRKLAAEDRRLATEYARQAIEYARQAAEYAKQAAEYTRQAAKDRREMRDLLEKSIERSDRDRAYMKATLKVIAGFAKEIMKSNARIDRFLRSRFNGRSGAQ